MGAIELVALIRSDAVWLSIQCETAIIPLYKRRNSFMIPRVFTIPPSVPFLPALIEALAAGTLVRGFVPDPLALADATIFLPTRRACRLARDAFLDVLKGEAALLPRIMPIGDIDEDELAFADAATGSAALEALTLPPAIDGLERRLLLARLVRKWAEGIEPRRGRAASRRPPSSRRSRARRRSCPADGRHGDARGAVAAARRPGAGSPSTPYWQLTCGSSRSRAKQWPAFSPNGVPSSRRSGATG